MTRSALCSLAAAAGIETVWRDASGKMQVVSDDSLRPILDALGLPARSDTQIRDSEAALQIEQRRNPRPLTTSALNTPIHIPGAPGPYRITLESGRVVEGVAKPGKIGQRLPALHEVGYHRAEIADGSMVIAVAPRRAYTLDEAGEGKKLWGLSAQLYSLRGKNSGAIGDFGALGEFICEAASQGADAVGISPVHAQFSSNTAHYGPYSASNRAAFNVLYTPLNMAGSQPAELIDWPVAASSRLQSLRSMFENFQDWAKLDEFRRDAGIELEYHVLFEAIFAVLSRDTPSARNFRNWPPEYQDPRSTAVAQFAQIHKREIDFHCWLQYQADTGLARAQQAARGTGMKIGIITDLAVGTDPTGSHSWTRQNEILRRLEIGAPPDLFNRSGQNWGITGFSPRGLQNSGFSAFIDMLRHALRHAGGLRIDHVMGLTRLWIIPSGFASSEGAYLRMPAEDLMRLVKLESQRHRAVVLGEDLGTVPLGFRRKLDAAGISGLRVAWFERKGAQFKPPRQWTRNATAMTTTHDLPTTAGWWQGTDITWRAKLGISGETRKERNAARAKLWTAFRQAGSAKGSMPAAEDSAAVVDAACTHLGSAACALVLLPMEDLLGVTEQPNLPGTIDEHPNWRRRLPYETHALFARPEVKSRLAALAKARKS